MSFLTAAWFSGPGSNQRYLYASAAIAAMSVMPWTVIIIFPVNNELTRRGDALVAAAEKGEEKEVKGDGRDVVTLIRSWVFYNDVRASLAVISTAVGLAAYFQ